MFHSIPILLSEIHSKVELYFTVLGACGLLLQASIPKKKQ